MTVALGVLVVVVVVLLYDRHVMAARFDRERQTLLNRIKPETFQPVNPDREPPLPVQPLELEGPRSDDLYWDHDRELRLQRAAS